MSSNAVELSISVGLFVLGGVVGSFLNVVVFRLPAGMSIVKPASHCPACKRPIRWFDNVPIIGWLILRGRCRDCRTAISPRYPLVEAVTAVLFAILGAAECLADGANLPGQAIEGASLQQTSPQLYGICAYHLLLLCTLLAAALIEYDGNRLPARLFLPAVAGGLAAPLVWPHLHPVPAWPTADGPIAHLVAGPAGLAAGLLLGWFAACLVGRQQRAGILLGSASVGLFLGWQAVALLTPATLAVHLPVAVMAKSLPVAKRIPATAWLAPATLGWILAWSWLVERLPVLG